MATKHCVAPSSSTLSVIFSLDVRALVWKNQRKSIIEIHNKNLTGLSELGHKGMKKCAVPTQINILILCLYLIKPLQCNTEYCWLLGVNWLAE